MVLNSTEMHCERTAFQDWYETDAMPLEHSNWFAVDGDGSYEIDDVATAWRAWLARAELEKKWRSLKSS